MPEIGSYNQTNITGPVDRKNNIGDKSVVNKTTQVDPLKGIELQANEQLRIDEGIKRARNGGNPSLSSRGELGQPQSLATVRDFELRSGPGARQEGALGPRGRGVHWVAQPDLLVWELIQSELLEDCGNHRELAFFNR